MSADFDPYGEWLKIPAQRRPPTHYDLLGMTPLESDAARIHAAAEERVNFLRSLQMGPQREIVLKLIGEVSRAAACLADAKQKEAYDAQFLIARPQSHAVPIRVSPAASDVIAREEFQTQRTSGSAPAMLRPIPLQQDRDNIAGPRPTSRTIARRKLIARTRIHKSIPTEWFIAATVVSALLGVVTMTAKNYFPSPAGPGRPSSSLLDTPAPLSGDGNTVNGKGTNSRPAVAPFDAAQADAHPRISTAPNPVVPQSPPKDSAPLTTVLSHATTIGEMPEDSLLAHFRFDGNAKDENPQYPEFELKNTQFKDNALFLNGKYGDSALAGGYRAVCKTHKLVYSAFTVAMRFKAEQFGPKKSHLFCGGTSYRWFSAKRSSNGNLSIEFNNHSFSRQIVGAQIEARKWTVLACGVDLPARKVVVYLDRQRVADIELPENFKLRVIDSDAKEKEKNWSFSDYSNGDVFQGLIDELIVYGRMLSVAEFDKLPLRP